MKKKFTLPISLGIASVWFATHAGPGAAAGKLTAVYFSRFSRWGLITPVIAMLIMAICIYVGVEYSRIKKITNFHQFTQSFFHPYEKIFTTFFEVTYLLGVIAALAAGIAAAAGAIQQYIGLPYMAGALIVVGLSVVLSIFGVSLIRSSSTVMTVFIVVCLAAIVFAGMASPDADFAGHWAKTSFSDASLFDAFVMCMVYAGFLTTGCVANAISVSGGLKSQKESFRAAGSGFIMNVFLVLSIAILLFSFPDFIKATLPNYAVVEHLGFKILLFAYVLMLLLAVLSTAAAYAYSTASRYSAYIPMKAGPGRDLVTVLLLFGVTYLISLLGLDTIISKGYTYLGYAVIPTVILPLIVLGKSKITKARKEEAALEGAGESGVL